jgi:hypothetical protein
MQRVKLKYDRIEGKTYSLFANNNTTDEYYRIVSEISDDILYEEPDIRNCINIIRKKSNNTMADKLFNKNKYKLPFNKKINQKVISGLSRYTLKARNHIEHLPLSKYTDKTLSSFEFQYHLYMIETELTNRANKKDFLNSDIKIALLPHCLRESFQNCKAEKDKFDERCKFCLHDCYINNISRILIKNKILPYIWMQADINKLVAVKNKIPGILGIACLPELVSGLRRCEKLKIPAIGIPLNANRCKRWMDDFYSNSVDLIQLEKLLNA